MEQQRQDGRDPRLGELPPPGRHRQPLRGGKRLGISFYPRIGGRQMRGMSRSRRFVDTTEKVQRLLVQNMSHEPLLRPEAILEGCKTKRERHGCCTAQKASPCRRNREEAKRHREQETARQRGFLR